MNCAPQTLPFGTIMKTTLRLLLAAIQIQAIPAAIAQAPLGANCLSSNSC